MLVHSASKRACAQSACASCRQEHLVIRAVDVFMPERNAMCQTMNDAKLCACSHPQTSHQDVHRIGSASERGRHADDNTCRQLDGSCGACARSMWSNQWHTEACDPGTQDPLSPCSCLSRAPFWRQSRPRSWSQSGAERFYLRPADRIQIWAPLYTRARAADLQVCACGRWACSEAGAN